mmetsp:Transcript_152083/g.265115  ORF Transcript_152083/g.265115 Transcript_152083/m.265115 type:complete len:444 (+) Transcript_152083:94-1425(+)
MMKGIAQNVSNSESLGEPLGAPPHFPVRLLPISRDGRFTPEGFVGLLGRNEHIGRLRDQLCFKLETMQGGADLMYEGRHLLDQKTMTENGILLPGPAQRRKGAMPEIFFDLNLEEMERQKKVEADALAEIALAKRQRFAAERAEAQRREEEELARLTWERERMAKEEESQRQQMQAMRERANNVLADLPMDLRRIEYSINWGTEVFERLQTMADMAGITLEDCMGRVTVISARGGFVMEMFSSDTVPDTEDFPFVLVFGAVKVEVRGPTHINARRFAEEDERGLPNCWREHTGGLLVGVDFGSDEFHAVTAYFRGTLGWLPDIVGLHRVQNRAVYSRFKGRKEKDLTIMFHGCRQEHNELSIMENGFQISKCQSGGSNFGVWCAYISSYSDGGFVFQDAQGIKHLFICIVSKKSVKMDNQTMRVVGQDCAYPLWRVTYRVGKR